MESPRYLIITPVRNEEANLRDTVESVARQSIRPVKWVIINDGSTDRTGVIADEAAREHDWIKVVHRKDRGFRKSGAGVIEAFYDGYELIKGEAWDYLIKLDGDLSFATDYFEKCFARFKQDERLGVGGGMICVNTPEGVQEEAKGDPAFHVRGATKIYRRACWEAIGGVLRETGWDTLDEVKANMLGWRTYTFRDVPIMHHRETGGADGTWKNWVKNGRANYVVGYHPLFMLCKCALRLWERPYVIVSAGLLYGFVMGYVRRLPCSREPDVVRYLRREQMRRLMLKSSIWAGK
ncbi:glycosyltransferase [Pedosphaera parvula]|uniref:Glycosyl transferase family 2 n=1 Tax=Pedosphaera parvula (strain Ellin514) TaxID=320771 RepID=B9XD22_PEDPL|nr:glycosyltransferase family A protein [Pedosphaera parvula]EEF62368.1 glycosyl transferase family 2 [Pedosphaera parvula Ellin514]